MTRRGRHGVLGNHRLAQMSQKRRIHRPYEIRSVGAPGTEHQTLCRELPCSHLPCYWERAPAILTASLPRRAFMAIFDRMPNIEFSDEEHAGAVRWAKR